MVTYRIAVSEVSGSIPGRYKCLSRSLGGFISIVIVQALLSLGQDDVVYKISEILLLLLNVHIIYTALQSVN